MHITWESVVFTICTGLLNASIVAFLGLIIRQFVRSRPKKQILHCVLLALAGVSGFVVLYVTCESILASRTHAIPVGKHLIVLLALPVHWATGSLVFLITRLQYGRKFTVRGKSGNIQMRSLYTPPAGRLLVLDWNSVSAGIKSLMTQIEQLTGGGVDFCVGINNAGGAVASLLAGFLGRQNPLPVYVAITKGTNNDLGGVERQLPDMQDPAILVADMQLRSGRSLKAVVDLLRARYGNEVRILSAAFVVLKKGAPISNIWELHEGKKLGGCFQQEDRYLPEYAAFVSEASVRFPKYIQ